MYRTQRQPRAHKHTQIDVHFQCNKCVKAANFGYIYHFGTPPHTNNANAANHIAEKHSLKNTYIFGIKWLTWLTRLIRCGICFARYRPASEWIVYVFVYCIFGSVFVWLFFVSVKFFFCLALAWLVFATNSHDIR